MLKAGDCEDARELLARMTDGGVRPDRTFFNTLIGLYQIYARDDEVAKISDVMRAHSLAPDGYTRAALSR